MSSFSLITRFFSLLIIFVFLVLLTLLCFASSQSSLCHDYERSSLLQLKQSFTIDNSASDDPSAYDKVANWKQEGGGSSSSNDCCLWEGVECDEDNGHVISLDLSSSFLYGSLHSNSTLFNLIHLKRLNLADNDFNYSPIPTAISQLSKLSYLNLSLSVFSGEIPSQVFKLSNLVSLDLSHNTDPISGENLLKLGKPNWESLVSNLTSLEKLRFSSVNISSTVPGSLAYISSLTSLILKDCGLEGDFPMNIFQLPNLQILNVGCNPHLKGRLPQFKGGNPLKVLRLAETSFTGELPTSIGNLESLNELDVYNCNLSGTIPFSMGKLKHLNILDLSTNNFWGPIPSSFENLTQLTKMKLHSNHFSGQMSFSFSKLINLEEVGLGDNALSGTMNFNMFLGLKNLSSLLLSDNKLSVLIEPVMNGTLPQFEVLKLSSCNLSNFPEFLRHQKRMQNLHLRGNHMSGPIPEWLFNISKETLYGINLSQNSLTGELPPLICNLNPLAVLDLSQNKLAGKIPECLGKFNNPLSVLRLQNNSFSSNIPPFTNGSQLTIIDLSHNQLEGQLPKSLKNCRMLGSLTLESNRLHDVFPYWLGILPELRVLVLRSNRFHGVFGEPQTKLDFPKLRIIDLSHNNFFGKLPSKYIQVWKAMKNSDFDELSYMESKPFRRILYLSYYFSITITIKGVDTNYSKIQEGLSIIHLANNKFDGKIPKAIGELKGLKSLDLSNNNLTGGIPSSLGNLINMESLDLSQNKLTGEIPQELTQLTFLQYMNVSHNCLTGLIPQGNQLGTFPSSSYEGNVGLCGSPLAIKCGTIETLAPPEEEDYSIGSSIQFGWKVVAIGYGCGFVVGASIGKIVLKKRSSWLAITFGVV